MDAAWTLNQNIRLMNDSAKALREYLDGHEDDIAFGINDFGDLKPVFKLEFGRDAESVDHLGRVVK